ncbi:MAG: 5'-methylthioadenosine/adenosylhomocysteine nucleosidase [Gammaproteobacteria bacterium]
MKNQKAMRLGIISALQEEQQGLVEAMHGPTTLIHGMRDYTLGRLAGIDVVCVLSRIGKVAAATTVTMLVEKFGVTHIVFTGVAGAADHCVHVGDIVVAESLVQYDMDASPLFPRFEVPLTGISHFLSDVHLTERLAAVAGNFLELGLTHAIPAEERDAFRLHRPRLHRGLIASGDRFVASKTQLETIQAALPGVLAVEMEGAAVAQVCFELGVPFTVVRAISDNANDNAATDFLRFVKSVAAQYAFHIVRRLCAELRSELPE